MHHHPGDAAGAAVQFVRPCWTTEDMIEAFKLLLTVLMLWVVSYFCLQHIYYPFEQPSIFLHCLICMCSLGYKQQQCMSVSQPKGTFSCMFQQEKAALR